jgi:hypothetical protein
LFSKKNFYALIHQMIDQFEKEHPLGPSKLDPVATSTRTVLVAVVGALILILAAVVAFVRGNPAPQYTPLQQDAPAPSPTPMPTPTP